MKKNFKNIVAFVTFPILFEMHQGFKGHFLNELRVSFNNWKRTEGFNEERTPEGCTPSSHLISAIFHVSDIE